MAILRVSRTEVYHKSKRRFQSLDAKKSIEKRGSPLQERKSDCFGLCGTSTGNVLARKNSGKGVIKKGWATERRLQIETPLNFKGLCANKVLRAVGNKVPIERGGSTRFKKTEEGNFWDYLKRERKYLRRDSWIEQGEKGGGCLNLKDRREKSL